MHAMNVRAEEISIYSFVRHSEVGFVIIPYYIAVLIPKDPMNAAYSTRIRVNCQKDVTI